MNRSLVFDLATANWVGKREEALFLGPPGKGKTSDTRHPAGLPRVVSRNTQAAGKLADATLDGKHKELMEQLTTVPS